MRRPLRGAMVAALLAALADPAGATLCTKRSGVVVFRQKACKRKEATLELAVAGEKGDPGAAGVSQPRLRVVDANGQRLPGSMNQHGELVYPLGDALFGVVPTATGFEQGLLVFEAPDCVGPKRVYSSDYDLYSKARVLGTTAWYASGPGALGPVESSLFPSMPQGCRELGQTYTPATGLCCANGSSTAFTAPAASADLSGFVPPFRVELEP